MKPGSIAFAIKHRTQDEHRVAERAVEAFAPFASRERYGAYLCKLHGFYTAVEPALFDRLGLDGERRKLPRIEHDLERLGCAASATTARWRLRDRAFAYGVGYVLEGKTLGSRFLLEEARTKLGLDPGSGASFLAGYGAETGAMWRAYLDTLTAFVATEGRRAQVLSGARATFAAFTRWISESTS